MKSEAHSRRLRVTDTQLYIAIGVPIVALVFAMLSNFPLVSRVEKRIEDLRDVLRAEAAKNQMEVISKLNVLELRPG
jgi:ribosomal 50S subunit-associated protein YjgA (DUF615 family)